MRFDLESLKAFVAVVEEGSLTAASERQHVVASAVSRRMSELEGDVGTSLLYRHSRGVAPTPAGETLYHHAKRLIDYLAQVSSELSEYAEGVRGHARIHVNISAMVQYLPSDLSSFLAKNPQIKIDLVEKTSDLVVRAVEAGATDVGICSATVPTGSLEVRPYRVDTLVLIVPRGHPLARRKHLRFEDTLPYDYVGLGYGTSIHQLASQIAERSGRHLKLRIQVSSFEGLRNMVSSGMGIGLLPKASVLPYLQTAALKMIELEEPWAIRPLCILCRDYEKLPVPSRLLIEHLVGRAVVPL